jgi:N-acetylated-alpha-linked acidic dipeptidase
MTTTATNSVLEAVSRERLRAHLEWFSKVRRDTGGAGETAAANYICETLRADGVPVTLHKFDAFLSYPRHARLGVAGHDDIELPCLTHSFAASAAPGEVSGELIAAKGGMLAKAAGRVTLVNGLATPITILEASRAGCAAIVFANEDRVIHNMIGTTIWGTPELDQMDRLPKIPAVSINRESGALLTRLLDGGRVDVAVETTVDTGWTTSLLPEVRIEGAVEPEPFALIGGHYCAWDVGVTDNATGDACLLEIARILWSHRSELRRSVRVCWWPGHSHGRYSGSTWYADTFFTDLAERCLAYQNIDSPGVKGATSYVARHTCAELQDYCRSLIHEITGQADAPIHRPSRAADQSFLANGVPSFSAYPFLPDGHPDRRPWTGGSANAWWWHTDEDTRDKADEEILVQDVRLGVLAAVQLANAAIVPLNYAATAREILEFVEDLQPKTGGHVDFGPIVAEAQRFAASAATLEAAKSAHASDPAGARRVNAALIRLGRILNPVIYSQRGRFHHDPAEWSPIMRSTARYTLAGLGVSAGLPEMAGTRQFGFLRAQVVREMNRVVTALREANALLAELA